MSNQMHSKDDGSNAYEGRWSLSVFAPLKITIYYIFITIFLHLFGPWTYNNESSSLMFLFMLSVIGMFALGYWQYAKKWRNFLIRENSVSESNYQRFARLSFIILLFQSILVFLGFITGVANGEIHFADLLNPGKIYVDALASGKESEVTISYLTQVRTIFSPLFLISNVFLLFNYSRIKNKWSRLLFATLMLQLILGLLTKGAQKGIFDMFIMLASVGILKSYLQRRNYYVWRRFALASLLIVIGIFVFFQISRLAAYDALDFSGTSQSTLDRDSALFLIFGDSIGLGLSLFVGYISQGYYGLSLTLQLPFEWSYGLGNSFALTSYAEQYLNINNIFEKTYPYRMEQVFGWPAKMYWHTIFPWLASDLTFPGVIFLMYFLGRAYARSLIDSVVYESPLGISIFYLLTICVLYLPANNQLMQTREMMIATIVLAISWTFFGSRFRRS